ncbi:cytochrome c biogenesis protein ResB [Pseudoduganella albidiflava]|uniref:Cytochrome c biogenesis protein n=1 Tax=Pseudoduganella albidiflava TaxID=321983 RepID=A0A411X4R5_9BURK|nr:cytochrome c biogenesis protein ResB [Pseudoduganella albidiflava]QBI03990.1 cytochrome c biogenesis protein ResB [Pseudoduganella albidiflava]GGY23829.1 cytochrome c biogenesis protein [Pseudoduganella albidiflava]
MSTTSTTGIRLNTRRQAFNEAVELLSSMRFAIALLVMIAISAIIGTIMQQNQPMPNYVNQFGPFWFDVFDKLGLYAVYSAWWFLVIMGILVVSTSLCVVRNAPKMVKDMRSWRENVREQSLRNFHHKAEWQSPLQANALAGQVAQRLAHAGYQARVVEKDGGLLVAAKRGAANKFGYIFAHSAIVIICVGGLLDSDIPIRLQQWALDKTPFTGDGLIAAIPDKHRLGVSNPTFRGNTVIPEGQASSSAVLSRPDGVLIQDLPFTIQLKKFTIDFYSTGMPKLFASDVVVRDNATGETQTATIEVNKPFIWKGLAVYQASFEDGGSKLKLTGFPMQGTQSGKFAIDGIVGNATRLDDAHTVEWTDFRPFNVENTASQDVRAVKQGEKLGSAFALGLDKHLGSAAKNANNKDLQNVGPSVQYKVRDQTGQAREFQNYMQPVTLEGVPMFLSGVRASPGDPFSYLRIPADDEHSVRDWMRLRAALHDPALRERAAGTYAARMSPGGGKSDTVQSQLALSALKSLEIFAGDKEAGGYMSVSRFLEKVPKAEQEKAADIFMKILNGTLWELWNVARERDGLAAIAPDEKHARWLQLSMNALSDSFFYGAPVYLQLDEFEQVKASVFQVTRSPGKSVVYLGCLFLVLGVFAMFYVRERRLWVWVRGQEDGAHALMAMSTQRRTLDFDREFDELKEKLPLKA